MKYFIQLLFVIFIFYSSDLTASENHDANDSYLSQEVVRKSIEQTLNVLNEVYVYPDKAKLIQIEITKRMNQGAYTQIKTKEEFAAKMTDELIDVSKDGHLGVLRKNPQMRVF